MGCPLANKCPKYKLAKREEWLAFLKACEEDWINCEYYKHCKDAENITNCINHVSSIT